MWILGLKGLRSNDRNENVKKEKKEKRKTIGLISKINNFASASHFFVHFFTVLRHENV